MATNKGTGTLDFGVAPGSNEASVSVSGQTGITNTSYVEAFMMADDTTPTHTASDHRYAAALVGLTCGTPSTGAGFTIYARCTEKLTNEFAVRWCWTT